MDYPASRDDEGLPDIEELMAQDEQGYQPEEMEELENVAENPEEGEDVNDVEEAENEYQSSQRRTRSDLARITPHEVTRVLIERARQLKKNYPPVIDLSPEGEAYLLYGKGQKYDTWYKNTVINLAAIARMEFELGKLNDWVIQRRFPNGTYENWKIGEMQYLREIWLYLYKQV